MLDYCVICAWKKCIMRVAHTCIYIYIYIFTYLYLHIYLDSVIMHLDAIGISIRKSNGATWKALKMVASSPSPMEIIFRPDRAPRSNPMRRLGILFLRRIGRWMIADTSASYNNNFKCWATLAVPFLPSLRPAAYHYEFPVYSAICFLRHFGLAV